jgi:hypothetical protein
MSELGPETRAFLDDVRDLDDPSAADQARVERSIALALAAQGAAIAATGTASASAAGGAAIAIKVGLVSVLVVGAASAVIYTAFPSAPVTPTRAHEHAVIRERETPERFEVLVGERGEPAPIEAPVAAPVPERPARRRVAVREEARAIEAHEAAPVEIEPAVTEAIEPPPEPGVADTLADEIELLRTARRASSPSAALGILDDHRARFPNGQLATDREVERVLALCALGRLAEARGIGDRLRARLAGTPRGERLDRSCAGTP